ncbi:Chain_A [Hexamita inflata]|uniref:Leucine Rich Repeat Protein n=1 Tax=Hexamita inflata TaxID=28002 RepID=A0AA86V6B4_9EUKA|nr:Chain A [Hexamita inflata]
MKHWSKVKMQKYELHISNLIKQYFTNNELYIYNDNKIKSLEFIQNVSPKILRIIHSHKILFEINNCTIAELNIEQCKLKTTEYFDLPNLIVLRLPNNSLKTVCLRQFELLQLLDLSHNKDVNILQIKYLTNLTKLKLSGINLLNCNALSTLTQLQELDISNNVGIDITAIKNLIQLKMINISNSGLKQIFFIMYLINLTHLELQDNNIISIAPLIHLNNLGYINLQFNKITDFSEIYYLKYMEMQTIHRCKLIYKIEMQKQQTKLEAVLSNKIRAVDTTLTLLRTMREKRQHFMQRIDYKKNLMNQHLNNSMLFFVKRVTSILEPLNQENFQ